MKSHRVLVVGAGYAGLVAATTLARQGRVAITLVNDRPDFIERVRLHEYVCRGTTVKWDLGSRLGAGVRLVVGRVTSVDYRRSCVVLASGRVEYFDTCILATGSSSAGGDGSQVENACHIATWEAAMATRQRLVRLAEGARVVVVGGGLTGIELTAELAERRPRLAVTLVTAAALGRTLSPKARRVLSAHFAGVGVTVREHVRLEKLAADRIVHAQGTDEAELVIWCGGFQPSPLPTVFGLAVDGKGRASVDAFLRSPSRPQIVVIGDAAAMVDRPLRMACAVALPMGAFAAEDILRRLDGRKPKPFRFSFSGQCLSLGRQAGLLQLARPDDSPRNVVLTGRLAAFIKERICRYAADRAFPDGLPEMGHLAQDSRDPRQEPLA